MAENGDMFLGAKRRTFSGLTEDAEREWRGAFCFIQAADPQLGLINDWRDGGRGDVWSEEVQLTRKAVEAVNGLSPRPRFMVLCGDLVHAMPVLIPPWYPSIPPWYPSIPPWYPPVLIPPWYPSIPPWYPQSSSLPVLIPPWYPSIPPWYPSIPPWYPPVLIPPWYPSIPPWYPPVLIPPWYPSIPPWYPQSSSLPVLIPPWYPPVLIPPWYPSIPPWYPPVLIPPWYPSVLIPPWYPQSSSLPVLIPPWYPSIPPWYPPVLIPPWYPSILPGTPQSSSLPGTPQSSSLPATRGPTALTTFEELSLAPASARRRLLDSPYRAAQEEDLKGALRGMDPSIPLVFVSGNHDLGNTPTPATVQQYRRAWGDDYCSFWVGGVLCLVLNSQLFYDSSLCPALKEEQDLWLDRQLLCCSTHIPLYLKTPDEEDDYFNLQKDARLRLLEKFKAA
ncbi:hypothetical protein NHX12_025349, partial [Muraenolepis orangiensis]